MFYMITILLLNLLILFIIIGLLFGILFPLKFNNITIDTLFNVSIESLKLSIPPYDNKEKLTVYESGGKHFENVNVLSFFSQFFLLGILFLLFDVEVLLLYPFMEVIIFYYTKSYFLLIFFIFTVFLGFIYELFCGSLDF